MNIKRELHNQLPSLEGIIEVIREISIDHWTLEKKFINGFDAPLGDHYVFIARYGKMVYQDRRGIYRIELKAPVPTAPRSWEDLAVRDPKKIILPLGEYKLTFSKGERNHTEIKTIFDGSIIFDDPINRAIRKEYTRLLVEYAKHQTRK